MEKYDEIMSWIDHQKLNMVDLAIEWANINSHTKNLNGLKVLSQEIAGAFSIFGVNIDFVQLPAYQSINSSGAIELVEAAPAISLVKRPDASKQILLVCHMDTVFPSSCPFQSVEHIDHGRIQGPGIMDAKGGIVVMLKVLEALEQSSLANEIGWQVIINTDEEIGSPSSAEYLQQAAQHFDLGMVFEPALPNGNLVGARKGSGNFTIVVNGKAAHVGRNPHEGRSAIDALAKWITTVKDQFSSHKDLTINMGIIEGGSGRNVVADFAMLQYNIRYSQEKDHQYFQSHIQQITQGIQDEFEVQMNIHGYFGAPLKSLNEGTLNYLKQLQRCAQLLDFELAWQDSGGVCDGNRLAAAGLPTVDTLGVQGAGIHSYNEYVLADSFPQRTKLSVLFLLNWIKGNFNI